MAIEFPIYLDNHATTRTDPRVVEAMQPYFTQDYGNASSGNHVFGWRAEEALHLARERVAQAIGAADAREIVFTSGATESNNTVLFGAVAAADKPAPHIISVATEHRSVLDPCSILQERGVRVTVLPVDASGLVDPEAIARAIEPDTILVSVMLANNEIGVLQPVEKIGEICREAGVLFHSDAAQTLGKTQMSVDRMQADFVSLSAHKCYGPKGIGALYLRNAARRKLRPLLYGGGQERGFRSGTVAVPLAVGFARAVELCAQAMPDEARRIWQLRERLWTRLQEALDGISLNGHPTRRLVGNLNVAFEGVDGAALLSAFSQVALSSGSACHSSATEPSHVLLALGLPAALAKASLRFGIGRFNTDEEIDWIATQVIEVVRNLRARRQGTSDSNARLLGD